MMDILDKIRKPSIFILLLILNLRFLFSVVFDERQEILSVLTVLFFLFSLDYKGIRKEYLYTILLFVGISVLDFTPYKLNILTPLILMQCLSRVNLKSYLSYNIIILGGTAFFMFILFGTGRMVSTTGIDFFRIRYDFGFEHPNAAALYYWGLLISLILFCYLSKYRNLLWAFLILFLLFSIYLYTETLSRSFIISSIIFVLVFTYYSLRSRFVKDYKIGYSKYILYILPLLFTILTLYFGFNAKAYPELDFLFSLRFSLYRQFLDSLTLKECFLGTSAFDYIVIDNSYLHILFEGGILFFIYFLWLYFFAVKNIIRQQNFLIIAVLISFLVYGLMESLLLFTVIIGNNLFWVLLYKYRQGEIEEFDSDSELIDS